MAILTVMMVAMMREDGRSWQEDRAPARPGETGNGGHGG